MIRVLTLALISAFLASGQSPVESRWKGLQFLIGTWQGTGGGEPGAATGKFSFEPDLQGHVLVRRSFSDLANGSRHDDLLVVYTDGPDGTLRGMYFDSEGHVIRYKIATPVPDRVVFESDGAGPKYRLSYWMERRTLKGKFEIGEKTYLEWGAERI
jgi:hypothetical protein